MSKSLIHNGILILFVVFCHADTTLAQNCDCPHVPLECPPGTDCQTTVPGIDVSWHPGIEDIIYSTENGTECKIRVYFCSRNLTTTNCQKDTFGVSCEYRISKICIPDSCGILCGPFIGAYNPEEQRGGNEVWQLITIALAEKNPHNHFIPTVNQINGGLSTAWKLSFPACFQCSIQPGTGCIVTEQCSDQSCYKWYKVWKCIQPEEGPCESTEGYPCPTPCDGSMNLEYISGSLNKDAIDCLPTQGCTLCGY